jgi:hypothetical protein
MSARPITRREIMSQVEINSVTAEAIVDCLWARNSINPDMEYTADAGADYGRVAAWEIGPGLVVAYGDNAQTNYAHDTTSREPEDLAAWLESPDAYGEELILQIANVRGTRALPDPKDAPYGVVVSHDYYGGTSCHDLARTDDSRQAIVSWGTIDEAQAWIDEQDAGGYVTGYNEAGRPRYTIVSL